MTCSPQNIIETTYTAHGEKTLLGYNNQLNTLVASFRGSSNIQNWIDDIQIEHYTFKLIKFIQFSDTFPVSELTENSTEFYRLFYRYLSDAEFSE